MKLGKNSKNIPFIFGTSLPAKVIMGIKANKKQRSKITGAILNTKDGDALPCIDQKVERTNNTLYAVNKTKSSDEEITLKLSQTDDVDELDEEEEDERNEEK